MCLIHTQIFYKECIAKYVSMFHTHKLILQKKATVGTHVQTQITIENV